MRDSKKTRNQLIDELEVLCAQLKEREGIFQAIGHPIVILDRDHTVLAANRATVRATGRSQEELLGKKCYEIFHGTDEAPEECPLQRTLRTGQLETVDMEIETLGRMFLVSCTPVLDDSGRHQTTIHIATDITERKQSEEALRHEHDFNKRLIHASPAFIVSIGHDGKTLMMNDAMLQTIGYTAEEVVGKDYLSTFVPEADRKMLSDIFKRLVSSDEPTVNENRVMTKDGRELLVEWHGRQIFDASGNVEYFFGVGIDITERRRAEEMLRVKDHAIASSLTPMVLADLEGRITYANRAFIKLWGYDREEEVVGRMNTGFATSADQVQQIMEAIRTSGGWAGESIAKKKDGTPLDIQLSVTMVVDSDNTPLCTMASFLDIADRKRVEQAERMAEVGKLASGLVHEVRNPLNAMRMQIAVIRNKLKDPHHENMSMAITQLGRLEHEVLRVQHLANDFLAYGRPASDNPQTIELHWLLSDIAEFVKPEFEQIGVHVDVTKGADTAELAVCMDLSKLRQALLNLTENARQAMVNGGELRLSCDKPSNQEARIRVCDTGCGISPERLPRIFEVFYSTRGEGAGLGLAIVKRTVEAAGGRIAVESEIDRGTCFEIYLPLVTETPPAQASAEAKGDSQ